MASLLDRFLESPAGESSRLRAEQEKEQRRKEVQLLLRQLISSQQVEPIPGTFRQDPSGRFSRPAEGPRPVGGVRPRVQGLQFRTKESKRDVLDEMVTIDERMGKALGLKSGIRVRRRNLEKIFAPAARAETRAGGVATRQTERLTQQQKLAGERLGQQRTLADERADLQRELETSRTFNKFLQEQRKVIDSPESNKRDKKRAVDAMNAAIDAGKIPDFVFTDPFFGRAKVSVKQPKPKGKIDSAKRAKAEKFLKDNGKPVTDANIQAVIEKGLIK